MLTHELRQRFADWPPCTAVRVHLREFRDGLWRHYYVEAEGVAVAYRGSCADYEWAKTAAIELWEDVAREYRLDWRWVWEPEATKLLGEAAEPRSLRAWRTIRGLTLRYLCESRGYATDLEAYRAEEVCYERSVPKSRRKFVEWRTRRQDVCDLRKTIRRMVDAKIPTAYMTTCVLMERGEQSAIEFRVFTQQDHKSPSATRVAEWAAVMPTIPDKHKQQVTRLLAIVAEAKARGLSTCQFAYAVHGKNCGTEPLGMSWVSKMIRKGGVSPHHAAAILERIRSDRWRMIK